MILQKVEGLKNYAGNIFTWDTYFYIKKTAHKANIESQANSGIVVWKLHEKVAKTNLPLIIESR